MFDRSLSLVCALFLSPLLLTSDATSQSDSVPHSPANPVLNEGFLILHDNGSGVQAFSAFTQEFRTLASTGSPVLGTGDFVALVRSGSQVIGYSARLGNTASVPFQGGESLVHSVVHDDVALVVGRTSQGQTRLHAFSGQTGAWSSHNAGTPTWGQMRSRISRFVIAVTYPAGGGSSLACFGARVGSWNETGALSLVDDIAADGNIAVANVEVGGIARSLAFSGVHGQSSLSPEVFDGNSLIVAHNMAYVKALNGASRWYATCFSAYDARWIHSPMDHDPEDQLGVVIRDNWLVQHSGPLSSAVHVELIGARPHEVWKIATDLSRVSSSDDGVVFSAGNTLRGFSGLGRGELVDRSAVAPFTDLGAAASRAHQNGLQASNGTVHMFSPAHAAWAAPFDPPGSVQVVRFHDANALAEASIGSSTVVHGYSVRHNNWVAGPTVLSPQYAFSGSVSSVQEQGNTYLFDTRRNRFVQRSGNGASMFQGRNLHVDLTSSGVFGYSLQRGVWESIDDGSGFADLPLQLPPNVEENLAWYVDGDDDLVAYGSPGLLHNLHQFPDGTEYTALARPGAVVDSTPMRLAVRTAPDDIVRTFFDEDRLDPGLDLPSFISGRLWIPLPRALAPIQASPTTNLLQVIALPPGAPVHASIWMQALVEKDSGLPTPFVTGDATEPAWAF